MADVSGISFSPTIGLLKDAQKGASADTEQIANNLANVNTPNFRRSTVPFKEALAASLGTPASTDELALVTDDDWIVGFAFERTVPGGVPVQCSWIWAES